MIQSSRFRLLILGVFIIGGFSLLLLRLWYLQMEKSDDYMKKLPGTREQLHRLPGARGRILDRNGVELARNKSTLQIGLELETIVQYYSDNHKGVLPKYTWDPRKDQETDIVRILQEVVIEPLQRLNLAEKYDEEDIRRHYRTYRGEVPYVYVRDVNWDDFASFAEHNHNLPGVTISQRLIREYPFGPLTGHMMGYVKLFDKEIPAEDRGKYKFYEGDDVGVAGLEKTLDKYLKGKPGFRTLLINEHGRLEREILDKYQEPRAGDDVYLTIDIRMQYAAEMALREGNVGRGSVVVQNPNSGEIMAMVAVPNYDPNKFIPSITKKDYAVYQGDLTIPLLNRAISSFTPGSTFKVPVALSGFLAPGEMRSGYSCGGTVTYGNRAFPCWTQQKQMGGHGYQDLVAGLKNSCNCYFYQYGNDAGIDNIDKMGAMLGLGHATGLELEGEAPGQVPSKEWWKSMGNGAWSTAKTANVSIGQGEVLASPLQMSCVAATVANGSKVYFPTLVHHRVDRNTKDSSKFSPRVRTDLLKENVSQKQIENVRKGMWSVVNAQGGTGKNFKSLMPQIADHGGGAGKTGTAQNWTPDHVKDNHTWFICFAPYDAPKFAAAILIQGGLSGGSTAAPVAKRVIEQCVALDDGTYRLDPNNFGRLAEAKGSFAPIKEVKYANDVSVPDQNDVDAEAGVDAPQEDEPVRKVKAVPTTIPVPTEAPSIQAEGSVVVPKARTLETPRFVPNSQSSRP